MFDASSGLIIAGYAGVHSTDLAAESMSPLEQPDRHLGSALGDLPVKRARSIHRLLPRRIRADLDRRTLGAFVSGIAGQHTDRDEERLPAH
jgi:hypothetical protein